jgi:hypothetical protein
VSWRDADLRVRQPRGRLRAIRVLTWATAITGFVVLLMEVQRDPDRCHPNCFDGSDNTREAGHVWTAYYNSWQWEAQLVLGWAALLLGLWALYATGRRSGWQKLVSLGGALVAIFVWIVWITVQPSPARLS